MYAGRIVEQGPVDDAVPRPAPPVHAAAVRGHARPRRAGRGRSSRSRRAAAARPADRGLPVPAALRPCVRARCAGRAPALAEVGERHVAACHLHRTRRPAARCAMTPRPARGRGLVVRYPVPRGIVGAISARRRASACTRSTGSPSRSAGRDAGARRRVGLRQDLHGAGGAAARRRRQRRDPLRRPRHHRPRRSARCGRCAAGCRWSTRTRTSRSTRASACGRRSRSRSLIHRLGGSQAEREARVRDALERVELTPPELFLDRYPHELSGGQRQRVAIAAALVLEPRAARRRRAGLDARRLGAGRRPVAARRLCRTSGLAILMITHDLSTAAHFADRIAVMYLGRIVEEGPARRSCGTRSTRTRRRCSRSSHAATRASAHRPQVLRGETPDAVRIPTGCRFHPRCPVAFERCPVEEPALEPTSAGHRAACHLT